MPEVAQALIRTLSDDGTDVAMVTAIIAKDPGLTATLLRMANSAMFGLSRSVTTLDSAVSVVGTAQIRARALAICMANTFVFPPSLNRLEFWRSCMVCAGYAHWLAAGKGMDEQQAWLTGMMVRLGELLIGQRLPEALVQIELQPCGPGERWRRERELTGFDEGEVAAAIAEHWDFPESIANALRTSCHPSPQGGSLMATIVHLAALLADSNLPPSEALDHLPFVLVQHLGLDMEKLRNHIPDREAFSDISMLQD
ncbi:MAG: HDOD domain-containing protein [Burkholderiales bacterium]|nr:HDOD domain-containing protein [Burkholderiales bacterium]